MIVELFVPCFVDQLYPETAFNTVKVLKKAGCEVRYNPEQTCCGQPPYNAGFWDEAKEIGSQFLQQFSTTYPIVTPSASCTGMVKNGFNQLFHNSLQHNTCRQIQQNIFELSDFLVNVLEITYFGAELEGKAVYHDSCSALRECRIKEEPRKLLEQVAGLHLLEIADPSSCCGFGGTFSVKHADISIAMAKHKVEQAIAVDAQYIISTDASCLIQLQGYIEQNKIPIQCLHLADVLTSGWANI
jgi:L-lactate dehydrogenase complex protein LldE